MQRRKPIRPVVESLDNRTLLSGGFATTAVVSAQVASTALRLSGRLNGSYTLGLLSDTQASFQFQGRGTAGSLGRVQMSGSMIDSTSQLIDMTLTNRRGSVTLRLGETLTTTRAGGTQVSYRVVRGTGAYASATGSGTAQMSVLPRLTSAGTVGRMSLTLRS